MKKGLIYLFSLYLVFFVVSTATAGDEYGVYIKVIDRARGSFDEISGNVEAGLTNSGWEILARYDSGVPEDCKFRSRVIVFSSPSYAESVMKNGVKASFALPLRAGVYEDETGIHVNIVNPASINRTIIDETLLENFSLSNSNAIVDAIAGTVKGSAVKKQIGQLRTKGKVSGMGGGKFLNKIEEIYATSENSDKSFRDIKNAVKKGIINNNKDWKLIYTYDLSVYGAVIFGVTKSSTEGRAFEIAGGKRSSRYFSFPGLDHGAAFPIEVIVYKDSGKVKVVTLDEMYRMKLYFEDAGMWAFMKNMTMPGEIESEIVDMAASELKR